MDVPEAAQFTGARVYGSANTCRLLSALSVPGEQLHEIRSGDELDLGRINIHVLQAEHIKLPAFKPGELPARLQPPLRAQDYRMDSCFSFLVSVDDCRLLVAAGVRADQAEAADILLVNPIHNPATLQALLQRVQPKVVVPNHWDDLWRPLSKPVRPMLKPPTWSFPPIGRIDLAKFEQAVTQIDPRIGVLIPEMFTPYPLDGIIGDR
jgi:L-ascorbate metabolism protein UlaG (beta-lactamase superfamily)